MYEVIDHLLTDPEPSLPRYPESPRTCPEVQRLGLGQLIRIDEGFHLRCRLFPPLTHLPNRQPLTPPAL